jgi:hypothetical protein
MVFSEVERDKSGNIKLPDIGSYLKTKIKEFFEKEKVECNMKYIDPSYMIRRYAIQEMKKRGSGEENFQSTIYTTIYVNKNNIK